MSAALSLPKRIWRLLRDPARRYHWWRNYVSKGAAFQPHGGTMDDRYPHAFAYVQRRLGAESRPSILSFGCATGEEVFTLRRYFPNATIRGLDINPTAIATARQRLAERDDPRIGFDLASSTAAEPDAAYDALFCMAVLRDGRLNKPGTTRCDPLLDFADFAATIADFARILRPGGLLAIRHSNFRLCDTPSAPLFEPVFGGATDGKTLIFGPDNRLMPGVTYPDTIFVRLDR